MSSTPSKLFTSLLSSEQNEQLRIQINYVDSYQTRPTRLDRRSYSNERDTWHYTEVPITRIFGRTGDGRSALLHVHGVFPYVYIEVPDIKPDQVDDYIVTLYVTLNHAIAEAFKRNKNDVYIASIQLCKAVPFYGYHVGWQKYLKIYLLSPRYTAKAVELLRGGTIMRTVHQVYESHIPYSLQFFADFNLYGCGWLKLSGVYYRDSLPSDITPNIGKKLEPSAFPKTGIAEIEVDITADMIANRLDSVEQFTSAELKYFDSTKLPEQEKCVSSLNELWIELARRRQEKGFPEYQPPGEIERDNTSREVLWNREPEFLGHLKDRFKPELGIDRVNSDIKDEIEPEIPTAFETVLSLARPEGRPQRTPAVEPFIPPQLGVEEESESELSDLSEELGDFFSSDLEEPEELEELDDVTELLPQTLSIPHSKQSHRKVGGPAPIPATRQASINFSFFTQSITAAQRLQSVESFTDISTSIDSFLASLKVEANALVLKTRPPSAKYVCDTISEHTTTVPMQEVIYSKSEDVPPVPFIHAGDIFNIKGRDLKWLKDFPFSPDIPYLEAEGPPAKKDNPFSIATVIQYSLLPPKIKTLPALKSKEGALKTQSISFTARSSLPRKLQNRKSTLYMNVMGLEIHACNSQPGKLPNPKFDPVNAVFWRILTDEHLDDELGGILIHGDASFLRKVELANKTTSIAYYESEYEMILNLVKMIRYYDPDILAGYEVQNSSWGYIMERAFITYGIDLAEELSRVTANHGRKVEGNTWGLRHTTDLAVTGRHIINIWRVLRGELSLFRYTLQNVAFNAFKERFPLYTSDTLTEWYNGSAMDLSNVLTFYLDSVHYDLRFIEKFEIVSKYSEQARIIGVDYSSIFSRGSQYKVESLLCRLTKRENFMLISPSKKQVGEQNALEYIPLVMEPESKYYTSPVLVLDFQSLYPSIVIAYNYCYSTCLGRVVPWQGKNKLGFTEYRMRKALERLWNVDDLNIAPNGLMYAKTKIRQSLLANMLKELLDTRVMLKSTMKLEPDNQRFQKLMNSRQLALKLTANVIYGYTSATYSGRMPCAEIADSIVLTARETLERAIDVIESTEKWNARVVYGDTDSIFVHLPGKSRTEAFDIGEEIAERITKMNPHPVNLKFEKVYHPCILQTKKRYVGYAYESRDQVEPIFDAKGTETIRRDGTPAQQRIEEESLRLIFETNDLSKVKAYFLDEWTKILSGDVLYQEFCFAKEVKMGTYKAAILPGGAAVSAKKMKKDERAEPQYRERVPYVIITGAPGSRLADRVADPDYLVQNSHVALDGVYYIEKHLIPPLERLFNLMGADIASWYASMPKRVNRNQAKASRVRGGNLKSYFNASECLICGAKCTGPLPLCERCSADGNSIIQLNSRLKELEKNCIALQHICQNCAKRPPVTASKCISLDCPIYYTRAKTSLALEDFADDYRKIVETLDW
ncbi:DNA polymerase zeta catalytic subunit [Trichomonascus vanleenenianus]|uniref:DNA-directed DNA polymerase n=1 Tax=Trichomonascus vanleenenianus TaxID=2268995 RepID=UPI003ECA9F9F